MKNLATIWQDFKNEPDIWFLYGFLLTFTLSIRKIIYFYPIKGNFNEYSTISLYLSDIFLFLTLITWGISILCNKYPILSIYNSAIHNLYSKKVWITCWKWLKCSTWNIFKNRLFAIPLLLVFWAFLSIIWSDNKIIAFYRSVKIFEFFLLYIYIIHKIIRACSANCSTWNNFKFQIKNVPRGTLIPGWNILKTSVFIIIAISLFQSIIGIWQFIIQKSLGLIWLKESIISPETLGVAKIFIGSEIYLRAYGLFPHPNVLGGFLFISIILTVLSKKLFHACPKQVSHVLAPPIVPRGTFLKFKSRMFHACPKQQCSTWNIVERVEHFFRNVTFWWIAIAIQVLALILTFSKSAILGIIISLAYIFVNQDRNVPRGTITENDTQMFHVEHFRKYFFLSMIVFGFLLFYFKIDLYSLFIQSLEERLVYLVISIKAIAGHIFLGLGNGQFVLDMQKYASGSLEYWQFQPVHNVFLLILSELGIIGLFLFIWFLLELFHVEQLEKQKGKSILEYKRNNLSSSIISTYFKAILLGFIFIILFDHYLWDIKQGQIMLWMIIGIIAGLDLAWKRLK